MPLNETRLGTQVLTKVCTEFGLPILSRHQFRGIVGETPKQFGKVGGGFGTVFIKEDNGLVIKRAESLTRYRSFFFWKPW